MLCIKTILVTSSHNFLELLTLSSMHLFFRLLVKTIVVYLTELLQCNIVPVCYFLVTLHFHNTYGLQCVKQVFRSWISNYISWIPWDVPVHLIHAHALNTCFGTEIRTRISCWVRDCYLQCYHTGDTSLALSLWYITCYSHKKLFMMMIMIKSISCLLFSSFIHAYLNSFIVKIFTESYVIPGENYIGDDYQVMKCCIIYDFFSWSVNVFYCVFFVSHCKCAVKFERGEDARLK